MEVEASILKNIPIENLSRGLYQPRREFDPVALAELADSIKSSGLIQPIVVRPKTENTYEIIAGERRWRAAQIARLKTVSCLVKAYTNEQAAAVAVIENLQRKDLNPIEESHSLQRLADDFDYTHEEIAAIVGKSRAVVSNMLRLLHLDERIQEWLRKDLLSGGHGKTLAGLSRAEQFDYAKVCIAHNWSVRKLEDEIKKQRQQAYQKVKTVDKNIAYLERVATEHTGVPVKLDIENNQQGWIKFQYFDYDTLTGLLERLGIPYEKS